MTQSDRLLVNEHDLRTNLIFAYKCNMPTVIDLHLILARSIVDNVLMTDKKSLQNKNRDHRERRFRRAFL